MRTSAVNLGRSRPHLAPCAQAGSPPRPPPSQPFAPPSLDDAPRAPPRSASRAPHAPRAAGPGATRRRMSSNSTRSRRDLGAISAQSRRDLGARGTRASLAHSHAPSPHAPRLREPTAPSPHRSPPHYAARPPAEFAEIVSRTSRDHIKSSPRSREKLAEMRLACARTVGGAGTVRRIWPAEIACSGTAKMNSRPPTCRGPVVSSCCGVVLWWHLGVVVVRAPRS